MGRTVIFIQELISVEFPLVIRQWGTRSAVGIPIAKE
jgi:hypothetical protein